jgi:glycosyltransferase involved in cell wall biosynthesis
LAKALVQREFEVHTAFIYDGPNLIELERSGSRVHRLRASHKSLAVVDELVRLIRLIDPNIIQTWLRPMELFGGLAALWTSVPFVISERNSGRAYAWNWRELLRICVARRADAIIANSEAGRSYWVGRAKAHTPIRVIRNIVPFDEIIAREPVNEFDPTTELILFAGRYTVEKNVINTLAAFTAVLETRPNAYGIMLGDGPERDALLRVSASSGLGQRIRIGGFVSNLSAWMKRANVFVSISRYEGNPNCVLEAVACGCPVVVSDIPEHREFLDDSSAQFVSEFDPRVLATAIQGVLDDPAGARSAASRAKAGIGCYSAERAVVQHQELYNCILQRRQVRRLRPERSHLG